MPYGKGMGTFMKVQKMTNKYLYCADVATRK